MYLTLIVTVYYINVGIGIYVFNVECYGIRSILALLT